MGKQNLRPGEYRTAWEALESQVEGAMELLSRQGNTEGIAELNPEAVVLEVDGEIFCYLHGAVHLSKRTLLEILELARRAVSKPKEEVVLWALWESANPPKWEYLAGACRCRLDEPCPSKGQDEERVPLEA